MKKLWNASSIFGMTLVLGFLAMAVVGQLLEPHNPATPNIATRLVPPAWVDGGSATYLLGTDQLGRDILSRLIRGARIALLVGFSGAGLAAFIGVLFGLSAGFFGGWWDTIVMRLVDALMAIPNIVLYLAVIVVFGPSLGLLIGVIGCINWTSFARIVRAEVLSVRSREFVEAARASGQRQLPTLLKHVLPNVVAPIIVVATFSVATVIILEASLSFLGFGVQPPSVTWGRMLADGRNYVATAWWLATFPGLFITALTFGLILVGDRIRDVLDPRHRR